jgi:hypothetical protein
MSDTDPVGALPVFVEQMTFDPTTVACVDLAPSQLTLHFPSSSMEQDLLRFRRMTGRSPLVLAAGVLVFAILAGRAAVVARGNGGSMGGLAVLDPMGACAIFAVTAVALGALHCIEARASRSADTAERRAAELRYARITEALPAAAFIAAIVWVELSSPWASHDACHQTAPGERCTSRHMTQLYVVILSVFFAPRVVPWIATAGTAAVVCTIIAEVISMSVPQLRAASQKEVSAADRVSTVLVTLAIVVAFAAAAVGSEKSVRAHFIAVVQQQRGRLAIESSAVAVRTMLASALPAQLLDTALLPEAQNMAHYSTHATCVIANIHSFAEWSTGLLVSDVVEVLHRLVTAFDLGIADFPDVVCAMTYGDSYVAVSGLVTRVDDPAGLGKRFAEWQLGCAAGMARKLERPFSVRVAVASGSLVGGVVGGKAKRYVVTGEALQLAAEGIRACSPDAIAVVEDSDSVGMSPQRTAVRAALAGDTTVRRSGEGDQAQRVDDYAFSRVWLRFADSEVQDNFNRFNETLDAASTSAAVLPLVLFSVVLLILVVEAALRGGVAGEAPAIALLCAAVVLAALQVAYRVARVRLPVAAAVPLLFCCLAAGVVGVVLSNSPSTAFLPRVLVGCAMIDYVPRAPWMLQAVVVCVAVMGHTAFYTFAQQQEQAVTLAVLWVVASVGVTLQRYGLGSAAVGRFIASSLAATAVGDAQDGAAYQEAMLAGLVPLHVVPFVQTARGNTDPSQAEFLEYCDQISVVAVDVAHPYGVAAPASVADAFRPIVDGWRLVNELVVAAANRVLEVVQGTGDTFLVAGPFNGATDDRYHAAARAIVELLCRMNAVRSRMDSPSPFVAVATAGSACGALLGASKLKYRMFGGVIRESTALLDEAPRAPSAQGNTAFATEAFRRQYSADPTRRRARLKRPTQSRGMSTALRSLQTSVEVSATDQLNETVFGQPLLWRVKGVGAATVSTILL